MLYKSARLLTAVIITASCILTGCSTYNVTGTQTTETTETTEDSAQEEMSEEANKILDKMKEMGITGSAHEGNTLDETEPDESALRHNAEHYVFVTSENGDTYYGAIINGEIDIWSGNETYNKALLPNAEEYDENLILQVIPKEDYTGNIDVTLMRLNDLEKTSVTLTEQNNYTIGVDLSEGKYETYNITLSEEYADMYYVQGNSFTITDEQQVVQLSMEDNT